MPIVKVSQKHQITLPRVLRQKLNIDSGDYLEIEEICGKMMLRTIKGKKGINDLKRKEAREALTSIWENIKSEDPEETEKIIAEAIKETRRQKNK
jgi:AbrB family looped-hinge helix DNA binding protein